MKLPQARCGLLYGALFGLIWAVAVAVTGGVRINTAAGSLSSRDWDRPLLVAVALVVGYVVMYRRYWRDDLTVLARAQPVLFASICAVVSLTVGIRWGTFIGSGPDASGYVSQADMWHRGALTVAAPAWAADAPWNEAVWSAAPVGYRPQYRSSAQLAPVYSPGLPLLMAAFQAIGGRTAVFYVVPLLGALTVWFTFLLGRQLDGPWAGAIAALLLVSSPPFLWFLTQPMSDVAVTAWWTAALVFAWRRAGMAPVFAGGCTAVAILIRPNLAPLAFVVAALAALDRRLSVRRLLLFGLAAAPGPIAVAVLNWYWHGTPLRSGYGTLGELYSTAYVWPNVQRYFTWMLNAQTPLFFLGFAAPFVRHREAGERRRRYCLFVFPLIVFVSYFPYFVFDLWDYLRFLLPAYPVLLAGVGAVLTAGVKRFSKRSVFGGTVAAVIVIAVVIHGVQLVRRERIVEYTRAQQRFAEVVAYANRLPANAIFVSLAYSGTLRFYTGRDVLRWEVIDPGDLDAALAHLRGRGHPLYFIGETLEVRDFTRRFSGTRAIETFARAPVMMFSGFVVYDLTAAA